MNIVNIVIVGGGAGGLALASKLGGNLGSASGQSKRARITLVDRASTHVWKPLLHEVAAGTLNAFHDEQNYFVHAAKHHYDFQLGSLVALDRKDKHIVLGAVLRQDGTELVPQRTIKYDFLVVAVGSTCNDFGTSGAQEHCIYLDSRLKADTFHQKFLEQYIVAHSAKRQDGHDHTLPIVIVGAGATGVELAAELHFASQQYVKLGLSEIASKNVSITLIEAGPRILAALPEKIANQAMKELKKLGIKVLTSEKVIGVTATHINTASGLSIESSLKAWCAGIKAPEFLSTLDKLEVNRLNQLVVRPTLQTSLDDNIFAFGDCAMCQLDSGIVPPRAQAAHQQANLLAKNIHRSLNQQSLKSFVYNDRGSLVSLSSKNSVGTLMGRLTGNVSIHGFIAKIIYRSLYRGHQYSIHGLYKTLVLIISDVLGRSSGQRTKLH